jgi:hypothetical protein
MTASTTSIGGAGRCELYASAAASNDSRLRPGLLSSLVGLTDNAPCASTRQDWLGSFTLAYLVRNTIMNLTTQDAQVECFRNVASHLEPGGLF